MTDDTNAPLPLPGLEDLTGRRAVSEVERGVRRTLAALLEDGKLREVDAGRLAVAVSLAQMMASKQATGRGSTFSNDARLLVELLDQLEGEAEGGDDFEARMQAKMAEWERELRDEPAP